MTLRRTKFKPRKVRVRKLIRPKKRVIFGKKWRVGFYLLVLGVVLFGIFRFLRSDFFTPLSIDVSIHQCGEYACLVEGDIKAEIEGLFGGRNLIFTDFGELTNQVKDQNFVIARVEINRSFLSRKLGIEVVGRKALAVVSPSPRHSEAEGRRISRGSFADAQDDGGVDKEQATESAELEAGKEAGGLNLEKEGDSVEASGSAEKREVRYEDLFFVDGEGIVFAETETTFGLPVVPLPEGQKVEVGDRIEGDQINTYLEILRFLDKNEITIDNLEIGSTDQVLVYVSRGPEVVLSVRKEIEKQIGLLAVILQRYKVEGEKLKRVDLRFDKPVVQY